MSRHHIIMLSLLFSMAFTIASLSSCTKDMADARPLVSVGCDSISPSYHTCIKPILTRECYSCHSDSASQSGNIALDLETFSSLKGYLPSHYRGDTIYGSKFMAVISYKPLVIHMPPSYRISDSEATLIGRWISLGAADN